MSSQVETMINEIRRDLSQRSASRKDELRVMQTMLSDPEYQVEVYGKDGVIEHYSPCKDFRAMCSSVIASAARVSQAEAESMMDGYNVKKNEANSMIGISKEFINTYLQTGRKLPLGGRETSDISLSLKEVAERTRPCPQKIGVNDDGSNMYSRNSTVVPAHTSIRVHAPSPSWVKG